MHSQGVPQLHSQLHSHLTAERAAAALAGSGKSNVLDSVCFALTEDEKHLRVKSWSELVSTEPSVDKATVVLTFVSYTAADGAAERTRLSATVRKSNGERVFKLNEVRKSVKEVRLWLKNNGLDIEGPSLCVSLRPSPPPWC